VYILVFPQGIFALLNIHTEILEHELWILKWELSLSLWIYLYNKYIIIIQDVLNNKPFFPSIIIYTTF